MSNCTLSLVRAAPGGGKTTFANTVFSDIPKFENDQFFYRNGVYCYDGSKMKTAIDWCFSSVENCLRLGMDCCVSNTFTKKRYIDSYRVLAEKYGADFKVYRMMGDFENVHNVPTAILQNMRDNFEDYVGETYVYPNLNQRRSDPFFKPYMFTSIHKGDKISVNRFVECENEIGGYREDCIATVINIIQGAYDYLDIQYIEDDTGKHGICMSGDCRPVTK